MTKGRKEGRERHGGEGGEEGRERHGGGGGEGKVRGEGGEGKAQGLGGGEFKAAEYWEH